MSLGEEDHGSLTLVASEIRCVPPAAPTRL
jgi:hypothetical protein